MEQSGAALPAAPIEAELITLAIEPGPYATVHMQTEQGVENAGLRAGDRWSWHRHHLLDAGAPEGVLSTIDALVPDAHLYGAGLAVIVDEDDVRWIEYLPHPPARDFAQWAPLPAIVPMIEHRQKAVPHVLALVDRRGADIFAYEREHPPVHVTAGGASGPETKSAAGGWSQKRYQQRAEKTWDENAERVADRLTDIVHDVQAATVVVAGDPKAVELMVSDLAPDVAELVHHVAGSRAAGGRERAFDESLRWARDASARQTVAVLERFHADSGVHQRAVQGRAATAEALAEGRVQMLLVSDDGSTDHEAFFGPNPLQIGLSRETVAAMGVPEPQLGRTPDVFVRAALGSSAGVRVLPSATSAAEGVGALLRW